MKSFIWLLINTLVNFVGGIGYAAINFFIWNKGQSLQQLLTFNFFTFVSLIIFAIIPGLISKYFGVKTSFSLSLILRIGLYVFVILNADKLTDNLLIVGGLAGMYFGFYSSARSVITQMIVEEKDLLRFNANSLIFGSLTSIVSPLITSALIDKLGYIDTLKATSVIFGIILVLFLFIKVKSTEQELYIFSMFTSIFSDERIRDIAFINLGLGFAYAFGWGIMDIIILNFLGSLNDWAQVGFIMAILGIIVSLVLQKTKVEETSKMRALIAISSVIYAVVPVILFNSFTKETFLLFTFGTLIFNTFNGILTSSFLFKLQSDDIDFEKRKISYQMFADFFIAIGEFIPIFLILLLPAILINTNTLILVLIFISFAPLFFAFTLKKRTQSYGF